VRSYTGVRLYWLYERQSRPCGMPSHSKEIVCRAEQTQSLTLADLWEVISLKPVFWPTSCWQTPV